MDPIRFKINSSLRLLYLFSWPLFYILINLTNKYFKPVSSIVPLIPYRCPIFHLFHILCPSCGLTRSVLYAFVGETTLSFKFHPLGKLIFTLSILLWIISLFKRNIEIKFSLSPLIKTLFIFLLVIYALWGVYRNIL